MLRPLAVVLALTSVAWCENSLTRQERKDGFELLFDGKNISRWHSIKLRPGTGPWRVRKGILTYENGESWLASEETYFDFVLRLEYRTGSESDSGILLRASPAGVPSRTGMKLQILNDAGKPPDIKSTGSLWGVVAPSRNTSKPAGEWNQVELTVVKRQVSAILNGEKVIDVDLDDPKFANTEEPPLAGRLAYGHIGLQAHANGAPVEFRNLRIKALKIGPHFLPGK